MQHIYIIFFLQTFIRIENTNIFLYVLTATQIKISHNSILKLVSAIAKTIEF